MSLSRTLATSTILALTLLTELPRQVLAIDEAAIPEEVKTGEKISEAATSDLDVNAHKQNEVFEDQDHDEIEDLSVDPDLAKAEKEQEHEGIAVIRPDGVKGSPFGSLFNVEDGKPAEYDEEVEAPDGSHYTKHVRSGPGFQEVEIHSDHPMNIGDIIGQLMQENMSKMGGPGGPHGGRPNGHVHQRPVIHHMMPPPPFIMEMMGHPPIGDPFDDFFEEDGDPFDVIREIEASRANRGNGIFGRPPTINVKPHVNAIPDLHPALTNEVGDHNIVHEDMPQEAAQVKHVHNDLEQHSPLYMICAFFIIAVVGLGLWHTFLRDATSSGGATRKGREPEAKEISLSRFSKKE